VVLIKSFSRRRLIRDVKPTDFVTESQVAFFGIFFEPRNETVSLHGAVIVQQALLGTPANGVCCLPLVLIRLLGFVERQSGEPGEVVDFIYGERDHKSKKPNNVLASKAQQSPFIGCQFPLASRFSEIPSHARKLSVSSEATPSRSDSHAPKHSGKPELNRTKPADTSSLLPRKLPTCECHTRSESGNKKKPFFWCLTYLIVIALDVWGELPENKEDVGNGSKSICRVGNVLRSSSPDPKR